MSIFQKKFRKQLSNTFQRTSLSLLAATLATAPFIHTLEAIAAPAIPQIVAQVPQDWQTGVKLLKLLDNSGNLSSIGILFDIANKPTTTYANVVYQLYVSRAGEWREVYTNSGARQISKQAGRYFAPVESISLSSLSERISLDDIYNGDLKAITIVRYDLPNGTKDARFEIEEIKSFSSITTIRASEVIASRTTSTTANTTTINNSNNLGTSDRDLGISNGSQTVSQTTSSQTSTIQTSTVQSQKIKPLVSNQNNDDDDDEDDDYDCDSSDRKGNNGDRRDDKNRKDRSDNRRTDNKDGNRNSDNRRNDRDDDDDDDDRKDRKNCKYRDGAELSKKNPHRGHFSLAVLQSPARLSQVIARVSIKSKRSNGFLQERFIGDYRFAVNQRATFIRGLNPGDRLVVRLFDLQNRALGYTEVQLLKDFSTISLVLPNDPSGYGTLRTVSGIDSQRVGRIDNNVRVYDYFTQIQTTTVVNKTVARFLTTSKDIPTNLFNVAGLPQAPTQCSYTNAFSRGEQSLLERSISVFKQDLPPVMQVLPGQLSSLISINDSQTTVDVVRKILDFKDLRPSGIPTLFN